MNHSSNRRVNTDNALLPAEANQKKFHHLNAPVNAIYCVAKNSKPFSHIGIDLVETTSLVPGTHTTAGSIVHPPIMLGPFKEPWPHC
jgi:hypothetical protein